MILIIMILCLLMVFSLFMLAYKPERIYEVRYIGDGIYSREQIIFLKARDIADIQNQLINKEFPWDVEILSVEVVK